MDILDLFWVIFNLWEVFLNVLEMLSGLDMLLVILEHWLDNLDRLDRLDRSDSFWLDVGYLVIFHILEVFSCLRHVEWVGHVDLLVTL